MNYSPEEIQGCELHHRLRGRDGQRSEDEARRLSASLPVNLSLTHAKWKGNIWGVHWMSMRVSALSQYGKGGQKSLVEYMSP